jgi:hypothetical protein
MVLEIMATHDFDDCWPDPDVLFVPGGGIGTFRALQEDELLDVLSRIPLVPRSAEGSSGDLQEIY